MATTPDVVLKLTVDRLIDQIDDVNSDSIYITTGQFSTLSLPASPSQYLYEVFYGPGMFDPSLMDAACGQEARIEAQILVRLWGVVDIDEHEQNEQFLTDQTLGLFPRMTAVLKALHLHNLNPGGDSDDILAQPMRPSQMGVDPKYSRESGSIITAFDVLFDWDLS
ncbi:MAG: hypothetical protein O3A51_09880 [Verrucomicrobia bacterium]|nr:hypothetical protein [Verrucomicrobiota bacterium]